MPRPRRGGRLCPRERRRTARGAGRGCTRPRVRTCEGTRVARRVPSWGGGGGGGHSEGAAVPAATAPALTASCPCASRPSSGSRDANTATTRQPSASGRAPRDPGARPGGGPRVTARGRRTGHCGDSRARGRTQSGEMKLCLGSKLTRLCSGTSTPEIRSGPAAPGSRRCRPRCPGRC